MKFTIGKGIYIGDHYDCGNIKGKLKVTPRSNVGRLPTNAEYAKELGITKRMASKKRRGY